ncbi:hypothetical protein [Novosphingobium sp. FKTRR1]|uniref:hypothetical protein n=1 Tax=Novosphingobium sp. FKTRR1 TaxID=2879118 RepID=UPI001CF05C91|nr:hypothetical protein [Novosphingobium sp. FKTRR1]
MTSQIRKGSVVGAGAAINVPVGWIPDYVKVFNITDGTIVYEWTPDFTDGYASRSQNVVDNGVTGNASLGIINANGISAFAGSSTQAKGFTIGSAIAVNAKNLVWVAFRDKP